MRQRIQALVIILLLATCGGSLIPAILYVREAARRIPCDNNLRQLGMAVMNYEGTYGRFPSAAMPNASLPAEDRLSWLVDVMPFVEADNLFSRMDRKKGWAVEENRFAALLTIKSFQCPGYPDKPPVSTFSPSHYVGISGVGEDAIELPPGDPKAGFFGYERTLRQKDITRGQSDTAMATETSDAQGAWTAAGAPTVRGFDPVSAHFGGNHSRMCNVLFADGSVRHLDTSMSDDEWRCITVLTDMAPDE